MTDWVTDGARSRQKHQKASRLAKAYYRTLDLFLYCLEKLKRSPKVQEKIDHTKEFKEILKDDIELLNSRGGQLTPTSEG